MSPAIALNTAPAAPRGSTLVIIWNVTKIAASGKPGRLDLIRNVLVASASIPAVFPPVLIDVEAGGKRYQEMHVDGGHQPRFSPIRPHCKSSRWPGP